MLELYLLIIIILLAFGCELIDSSLGMGYGTILSPVLILIGLDPLIVIPSILFSEAFTGFSSAVLHHHRKNVDFVKETINMNIVYIISALSVIATIITVFLIVNIEKIYVVTYIGLMVIFMGFILSKNIRFNFSWKRIMAIGTLSAFNKTISGGGFGPLVTAGQIVSGRETKPAIGVTGACEVAVCIVGFVMYYFLNGITDFTIPIALMIGGVSSTPLATLMTKRIKNEILCRRFVGLLCISLGTFTIIKLFL